MRPIKYVVSLIYHQKPYAEGHGPIIMAKYLLGALELTEAI